MLQRSAAAKYAKHVFYTGFNDLDVFVEDTAPESRKIYVELLRRVLGNEVSLGQIFPIGTKSKVLARCAADQGARARKCVYIIDGDYDVLLGRPLPSLIRLFRLDRYCIENFLIDEEALVSILDEEVVSMERGDIAGKLDFGGWLHSLAPSLAGLITACGVGNSRACRIATVNIPLAELAKCQTGAIDAALVSAKIDAFRADMDAKHGAGAFLSDCTAVRSAHSCSDSEFVARFASGKALLMPLLKRRLQAFFAFAPSNATFKLRVAMRCDVSGLAGVTAAIA